MKILIVSQYFYPENFKVNDVAFDFAKKGHEVTVLTAKPNYPKGRFHEGYSMFSKREEIINKVRVVRTPIIPRRDGDKLFLALNYLSFIVFSWYACYFRIKGNYDIVLSHLTSPITAALPAIWLKKKFRIPLVLWVLDLWPESVTATTDINNKFVYNFLNRLVSYIYDKADTILVSSRFFTTSVQEKLMDKKTPIVYFPNWAEDIFTINEKIAYDYPVLPEGFNIMFAGNIGDAQDFESIVKAAELTKNHAINWVILGEGRKYEWLKKEKLRLDLLKMTLLGRHPLETMPVFFKKADAMLVSLKDEPIFTLTVPAKIQAYMASEKIILGMINGEANVLIQESECGYAVGAGDYRALAEKAIILKKASLEERRKMERNAKTYYLQNFTKQFLLSKLEQIFRGLSNIF